MKRTAILATVLGLGGFWGSRWIGLPPASPSVSSPAPSPPADDSGKVEYAAARPRPARDEVLNAVEEDRLVLLVRWLATATAEEVAEMAGALEERKQLEQALWAAVAGRWVEVAPEAAVLFARPLSVAGLQHFSGTSLMSSSITINSTNVYAAWLKLDMELALAKLPEEPPKVLGQLLLQLHRLVEKSRRESWAAAHTHLPEAIVWAAKRGEEAAALAGAGKDYHELSPEVTAIQAMIAAKDLVGSRAKIDALPKHFHRAILELDYISALSEQKSPEEAAAWAKANLSGLAKAQGIVIAAQALSKTDPLKALTLLKENKIPDLGETLVGFIEIRTSGSSTSGYRRYKDRTMLKEIVSAVAKTDPAAAMDYLLTSGGILPRDMQFRYVDNEDTSNNGSVGRSIYKDWLTKDARSAAAWLAAQRLTKGMSEMLPLAAASLTAQHGAEGRAFAQTLPQGKVRQEIIGYAAAEWALSDGGAALQWAANAGGEPALSAAFDQLAEKNAAVAGEHFSLLPLATQAARLQSLTDALGKQKPQALPQFYEGLAGELRTGVNLRNAMTDLARQNVEQASSWLNQIPSGKARDSGISALVDYLITAPQPDPEAAAHWAAASADPQAQGRRLERVARAWQKQNPSGAAAAIRSSKLAEPVQQQLIGFLNSPPTR
jgi:hypothetical protein